MMWGLRLLTVAWTCLWLVVGAPWAWAGLFDYRVGPEDVLRISVWRDDTLTREALVRPDGLLSFPLIGDVRADGRTVEEIKAEVAQRLSRYVPDPTVSVELLKVTSYRIYVIGKVNRPGEYLVGHDLDVMQALSLAGGLTPFAAENRITILRRATGETFDFRYGDVERGRELGQNIVLQRGDVVVVP